MATHVLHRPFTGLELAVATRDIAWHTVTFLFVLMLVFTVASDQGGALTAP
jgi:hypothetical protein